jgi:predicted regulator of Ras-like GTPase activity (Roadblock/LC7/MglB family)
MEQGLQEINSVQGVQGSLVCDNQGAVFASGPPEGVEEQHLEEICRHCLDALTAVEIVQGPCEELDLKFPEYRVLVRDYQTHLLLILCSPRVNPSLVRLSVNVVTAQWKEDQAVQRRIGKHQQPRPQVWLQEES